ncbi:MAG: serine/threonine protein kinase [Planctomycetes bacterium]|nr:serine/threonine protein kinase [Planctomycetota bacterium]
MHRSPTDTDRIAAEFLLRLRTDEERAGRQPLAVYLACYPGHEEIVAREFVATQDAEATGERPAPGPGTRIGEFVLERPLGRGAQGEVWLARDTRLRRPVALKVLHAHGALARLRFLREAFAAARLDHPGICAVYGSGEDDGFVWVAMRHVAGASLLSALAAAPAGLPASSALSIVGDLASTLANAHAHGLVHRDVKPSNVLLGAEGPVLLDFGLAHDTRGDLDTVSVPGEFCGTPAYMAPEQIAGAGDLDGRADVWALGVVLWECLTGALPFSAPTRDGLCHAILNVEPVAPPGWSRDLRAVLATALRKDRSQRYASAAALAADLARLRHGEPVLARPPGVLVTAWHWCRRRPLLAAGLGIVIAVMASALTLTSLHLRREADLRQRLAEAFADVRGIARTLAYDVWDGLREIPGTTRLRQQVLARAEELFSRLQREAPGDPALQRELLSALVRLGDVLGHDGIDNLGDREGATRCFAQARALAEQVWSDDPPTAAAAASPAGALLHWADCLATTDLGAGLRAYEELERRIAPFLRRWPDDRLLNKIAATIDLHAGNSLAQREDITASAVRHDQAVRRLSRLVDQGIDDQELLRQHAMLLVTSGRSQLRLGAIGEGIAQMRDGLQRLGGDAPATAAWAPSWAQCALMLGTVLAWRGESAGYELLDRVVAERERLFAARRDDARAGVQLASALYERGTVLGEDGEADLHAALALCGRMAQRPVVHDGVLLVDCRARLQIATIRPGEGTAHLAAAATTIAELATRFPEHPELPQLRAAVETARAAVADR